MVEGEGGGIYEGLGFHPCLKQCLCVCALIRVVKHGCSPTQRISEKKSRKEEVFVKSKCFMWHKHERRSFMPY